MEKSHRTRRKHTPIPKNCLITLFILHFALAGCLFVEAKPPSNNRNRGTAKIEDSEAEQALNRNVPLDFEVRLFRTLSKLLTDGEQGRFVLLLCRGKCLRERAQMSSWLREHNSARNASAHELNNGTTDGTVYEPVGFHFHAYKRRFGVEAIDAEMQSPKRLAAVFYAVGGATIPFEPSEAHKDKKSFLAWLEAFERPPIAQVAEGEFDQWLNSKCHGTALKRRRTEQQMVLLVVHDQELCEETLLEHFAVALSSTRKELNFTVLELARPLSEDTELALYSRLRPLVHTCRMDILIRGNLFTELPLGVLGSHINRIALNWANLPLAQQDCPDGNSSLQLTPILPPLGKAHLEFLREERILKAIEKKREYLTVGIIGGVAVVVLAMSIFWGLNGNDFVPKQQQQQQQPPPQQQ